MSAMNEAEVARLESRADLLERQAGDRDDSAAMRYGIGSSAYVESFDISDGYRAEARALRSEAARLRIACRRA